MTLKTVNITKREKSDIMCLMMENIRVYSLAKGSYYELDEVSESSCQFTRNTKDSWTCRATPRVCHQQSSDFEKLCKCPENLFDAKMFLVQQSSFQRTIEICNTLKLSVPNSCFLHSNYSDLWYLMRHNNITHWFITRFLCGYAKWYFKKQHIYEHLNFF